MEKKDVFLVFPNCNLGKFGPKVALLHPLSLGYLAAVLEKNGYLVGIIDASAEKLSPRKVLERIRASNSKILGLSTNIVTAQNAIEIAKLARKTDPNLIIVFGGPWATYWYEFLLKTGLTDFVVIGEGEVTFLELVNMVTKEHLRGDDNFGNILGIAFKRASGEIVRNPDRPRIEKLDEIPFPAWHLFPSNRKYIIAHRYRPFYPLFTSRGCPFQCINCTKLIHGNKIRFRSVENVLAEIEYTISRFGAREFLIVDDNFTLNENRARKILFEIIKRKLKIAIQFPNGIRADIMNPTLLKLMLGAGVYRIGLGIESGDQGNVYRLGKNLNLRKVIAASRMLKNFPKFITVGFFMLGLPFDTRATMKKTIEFARAINLDYSYFLRTILFPGTKMYELAKKFGVRLHYSPFFGSGNGYTIPRPAFNTKNFKDEDLSRLLKKAYRSFYFRPLKMLRNLLKVRTFTELKFFILYYGYISVFF
ncbi:MAG: B12-binding domain-containing radical SAM protein [Promethearchaeota archaeon]